MSALGGRQPKATKVKNKAPAAMQITAEQLIREANERRDQEPKPPKQKITDPEELAEYRARKRKAFEDNIRRSRTTLSNWFKYASWEEEQGEMERARSIFERALDIDHRSPPLWIRYAEMEMRHKNINHARNIWDRAVSVLPRVDQFWYKYAYMEEMLGEIANCRQIFERWMEWEPDEEAWLAYIKLEKRYKEIDRARRVFDRFVTVHPEPTTWLKYAKFEEEQGDTIRARAVFERALERLGTEFADEKLFIAFAKFETRCHEYERARVIFKYAIEHLSKERAPELYQMYSQFEKQHGDRAGIEDVVVAKRRHQYEEDLRSAPSNYDIWFDYIRLEESNGDAVKTREVYERAIAQIPPAKEKRFWRRYIYLWINYALFEELDMEDAERTRQVYLTALNTIPHKQFTFAKMWLMYARFEVRQKNLSAARKALGKAIGMCPKNKLFKGYIELELELREFDRCRTLYEKYLEYDAGNVYAWIKYAELEKLLGETERCRAIFELGISQPMLDMPELLWKAYIDFEFGEDEHQNTRNLYERLLERTEHVKVWISYAEMEATLVQEPEERLRRVRAIFERAEKSLKDNDLKEERVLLYEAWRDFEAQYGDEQSKQNVVSKMPKKIKKRRKVQTEDGMDAGWEEYYDYIFPADEAAEAPHLKLLAMAHRWKQQKERQTQNDEQPQHHSNSAAASSSLAAEVAPEESDRDEEP